MLLKNEGQPYLPGKHKRVFHFVVVIVTFLLWYSALYAQEPEMPPEHAPVQHSAGEADIASQGYYLGGSGQSLVDTSGMALNFREFIGGVGLATGSLQAYGSQGAFQMGENFLDLQQISAFGQHWRFTGGDFRVAANMVEDPFNNIYDPEIAARGFRVEVSRDKRTYGFFLGDETLQEGPRITFRVLAPQSVLGAFARQQFGEHLQVGVRYLHFGSSESDIENNPSLFPVGRQFLSADTLQTQSAYSFTKQFKLFGEATLSAAQEAPLGGKAGGPASALFGPAWESDKLTLRSNYTYQTASYFPLLGYFAGDRKGAFAEGRYRLTRRLEFSASANHYSNNLANDPAVADYRSSGYSAGASLTLPWMLSASANVSIIQFLSLPPASQVGTLGGGQPDDSTDRQIILSLNRTFYRHNLRFSYMNMKLDSNLTRELQQSAEIEDTFQVKKFVLGGAIRTQSADSTETRSTLYFRGSAQVNLRRVSAYGYVETGNDLLNRTLFATNSYRSTVVGFSAPVTHGWTLQAELFRNQLNTALNPENIFVMQSQGVPVSNTLSAFNQWSTYFRLSKHLHWGIEQPGGDWEHYAAIHNPLVGVVEGVVAEQMMAGNRGVVGIPVSLDGERVTVTQPDGHYRFSDVPEGVHRIDLDMQALPADFETGTAIEEHVRVQPRATVRADLSVVRLTSLTGKVIALPGMAVDNVVVRLSPSQRYTTPDADGNFTFYNLREGDYEVAIDEETLPDGSVLRSPARASVAVRLDAEANAALFEIGIRTIEKPVRMMIDQKIDLHDVVKTPHGTGGGTQ
jgi:hypothetical protein